MDPRRTTRQKQELYVDMYYAEANSLWEAADIEEHDGLQQEAEILRAHADRAWRRGEDKQAALDSGYYNTYCKSGY